MTDFGRAVPLVTRKTRKEDDANQSKNRLAEKTLNLNKSLLPFMYSLNNASKEFMNIFLVQNWIVFGIGALNLTTFKPKISNHLAHATFETGFLI